MLEGEWGGMWDLNPRLPEPQSGALPTELIPPQTDLPMVSRTAPAEQIGHNGTRLSEST